MTYEEQQKAKRENLIKLNFNKIDTKLCLSQLVLFLLLQSCEEQWAISNILALIVSKVLQKFTLNFDLLWHFHLQQSLKKNNY